MRKKYFNKFLAVASIGVLGFGLYSCSSADTNEIDIYVSTTGTEDGDGSAANPYNFMTAIYKVEPGQTIGLMGGTYEYSDRIGLTRSGSPNQELFIKPASENDEVIFDFSAMKFDGNNRGIQVYGNYWNISNISVTGAGDNGMYIAGSYNTIENCIFYNNRDTGLQLGRAYSSDKSIDSWPSYNLIKNCTSFANYDAETYGENADGFAAKLTIGYGNIFDGCVAFRNSDDGWDLFAKEDSGNIGTVILYNCVSFENGYLPYQIDRTDASGSTYKSYNTMNGDGIGFKLGGSTMEGDVIIENCLAFNNKLHGFSDNSNPGVISIKNSSAINNCIGLNDNGTVGSRGITGTSNKSNNFDLARSTDSYNNYYGLLSYTNNQGSFVSNSDNSYNEDAFRGSIGYSIFNTSYESGEKYTAFTSYVDASSYASDSTDVSFAKGTEYTSLSDSSFADTKPINALCSSVSDLKSLTSVHEDYRNDDNSVNLGDKWKITDSKLLTYVDGSAIGHNLSKNSFDEYTHYETSYFKDCLTRDDVKVASAYSVLEVTADENAVYQDFEIAKRIHGCEIEWTSSNEDIITIDPLEEVSFSNSVYISASINSPSVDTKVTLTATITCGNSTKTKTFELNVKSRNQAMGTLVNSGSSSIQVKQYGSYIVPKFYVTDSSSNTSSPLSTSLYDLSYKYEFATSKNSRFYEVDGVYTSAAGVYKVTVSATSKIAADNGKTVSSVYYVYIMDPNCDIDFIATPEIVLNNNGLTISGDLSNILGTMYTLVSPTQINNLTAAQLIANEKVQKLDITSDSVSAEFIADNNTLTGYYVYYVITNLNETKFSSIYTSSITVQQITNLTEFNNMANNATSTSTTVIYSLTNDLDFTGYTWKNSSKNFSGLFNGNGHKIYNLTISSASEKTANIFYKIKNGTVMNTIFENISITNTSATGKQVGIIGSLAGGYVAGIIARNISSVGYQGVGAIIGAVNGGKNYITECVLDNRGFDDAVITAKNGKYAGGIIGNGQKDSSEPVFEITIRDCAVYATIGDGTDAGGNNGGIIGRVKNESNVYVTTIENCIFIGTVISNGQYNAGIVGDFDNGQGTVIINYCYSDTVFIYDGEVLDARKADVNNDETQTYAHKNSNPIVGRAVAASGEYITSENYGTWTEYYSASITSIGWCFMNYYGVDHVFVETFFTNRMKFDLENTWTYVDGNLYLKTLLALTDTTTE